MESSTVELDPPAGLLLNQEGVDTVLDVADDAEALAPGKAPDTIQAASRHSYGVVMDPDAAGQARRMQALYRGYAEVM